MIRFICILLSTLGLAWFAGSPYYVAYSMKVAADHGDSDKLASYVDFLALQNNAKRALEASIARESKDQDPLVAALGQKLGRLVSGKLIESTITPEGLAKLLRTTQSLNQSTEESSGEENQQTPKGKAVSYGYSSWDRFVIDIPTQTSQATRLILTRQAMSWKLTDLEII